MSNWVCRFCRTPVGEGENDPHYEDCVDFEFMKKIYQLHCENAGIDYPEGHTLKLGWSLGLVTYRPENKDHPQYDFLAKARDLCVEYIKKGSSQAWSHFLEGDFKFTFEEWEKIDNDYYIKMRDEIQELLNKLREIWSNQNIFNLQLHFVPHLEKFAEKYKWAKSNYYYQR